MPTISAITIPAEGIQAICDTRGYAGNTGDNAAKLAFTRQHLINYLKEVHYGWKRKADVDAVPLPPEVIIT